MRKRTIRRAANKAGPAMAKVVGTLLVLLAFDNNGRAVTLNSIVVNGPDGWIISEVESPHDSLRMFLAQYKN